MKQCLMICFVLAFGLVGCAASSELLPTPTPTLPAPLITIVATDNATATPSLPDESPEIDEIDEVGCYAELTIAPLPAPLIVGEAITISVTYDNSQGCYPVGLPLFAIETVSAEGEQIPSNNSVFDPPHFSVQPVNSIGLGEVITAVVELTPLREGEFLIKAYIGYEYKPVGPEPQPWMWGRTVSEPLSVKIVLFDMGKLPECIPPVDLESLGYDWRDCTLTEIEGSDGWAAVQWGQDSCNQPGQLVLANLNTGELRRFEDRPLRDFFGERVEDTAVWGDRLLLYTESLTANKWLLFSGGCHFGPDSYIFLYDVAQDTFRTSPFDSNPDWNEARTAVMSGVWGYDGLFDRYESSISGYHLLTDQRFRVSGDRYLWTPDENHALLQTMAFEQTWGPLPADSTHYKPDQEPVDTSLITFSPPRSIQLANLDTGEVTLLAGEDGYSYWLCESEEACAWQEDLLPIRRIVEQPAHTLGLTDFNHPHYRCYTTADDCPMPVEYFLLNWRTGERTPHTILSPTPTPPPVSSP